MRKLIIFGTGKIGQVVTHHFKTDSDYEVVGFTTDPDFVPPSGKYDGLPVVPFNAVEKHFTPQDHALFVAVGYQQMNRIRAARLEEARAKGYATASYVSSHNKYHKPEQFGVNCFVMSGEPLQPHCKIGDNCFIWANAVVGHHAQVADDCWITSGAVIGGNSRIGRGCFLGLNATVGHEISIGDYSLIGAGARVMKDAPAESVYIPSETPRFRLTSSQFIRMGTLQ